MSNNPEISIVVAMDEEKGIGKDGKIPWNIPEDMTHFKNLTVSHPVIMGRVTWESIPLKFRPLPDRTNIVVTRSNDFTIPGIEVAHSIKEAVDMASRIDPERVFIIGGAQIYTSALSMVDSLNLTIVEGDFDCDAFFPEYSSEFRVVSETMGQSKNGVNYRFQKLVREIGKNY